MDEEPNPVKDLLYDYLEKIGENSIQKKIFAGESREMVENIISSCYPKISKMSGKKSENVAVLATSLIHFLLTIALIPSQRKIEKNHIEIDVVIPDLRSLIKSPKDSLVIYIPKTTDKNQIQEQINKLNSLQPHKENIWLVLEDKLDIDCKAYNIIDNSFSLLIDDIKKFLSSTKKTHFKIFKSD